MPLTRRDRLCNIIMNLTEWPRHPNFTVQTGYESTTSVFGQGRKTLKYITDDGLEETALFLVRERFSRNRNFSAEVETDVRDATTQPLVEAIAAE